jgi:hypothetical protein
LNTTDSAVKIWFSIRRSFADWINLAHDGTRRRNVMITAVNLQIPEKLGNAFHRLGYC